MLNYDEIIERLFQATSPHKPSLDIAQELDRALGFPASSYPTIHIAGSNGKGSVTTKIAKALELCGYKVGVYTSPHLFSFRERIAIGDECISEGDVIEGMERLFVLRERLALPATFFELTTFLALDYFRKKEVDVAVIETGLGGRLDATNVIRPLLSVITSISREHTQMLGEEVELIAAEKAGIIKENIPVVLGPKARCQAISDRAKQLNSPIFASKKISYFYDEENSAIAQLALEQLNAHFQLYSARSIDPEALREGLAYRPPCRFEQVEDVIFDVAHNPEAIFSLLQALHHFFPSRKFRFLVGFCKDKEYDRCLDLISDVATHVHLVQSESLRAATVEELRSAMKNEDPGLFTPHGSIQEGMRIACAEAQAKGEILVVCGSFYIMANAKSQLPLISLKETTLLSAFSSAVN